eukprot:scaffold6293_cov120-Cylindrotheca_fusiformis.AAC.3
MNLIRSTNPKEFVRLETGKRSGKTAGQNRRWNITSRQEVSPFMGEESKECQQRRHGKQPIYSKRPEFVGMKYDFFQKRLGALRTKWKKNKGIGVILDWDFSAAKAMLDADFGTDKLPAEEKKLSVKDAWKNYENTNDWKGVSYGFFSQKVRALRTKWSRQDGIDWGKSAARMIILYDLESSRLSTDNDEDPPSEVWEEIYSKLEEFEDVPPYWQFEENVIKLRKAHDKSIDKSLQEDLILADDLAKNPTTTHNARGEPKFYLTRAKQLLRHDIEKKNHVGLTASDFQQTRVEYHPFEKRKFRERIRQEIRFQKYRNYLQDKRMNKLAKLKKEEKEKKEKKKEKLFLYKQRMKGAMAEKVEETKQEEETPMSED